LTITLQGVPASPLRSVSCHLFDSESEYDGPATVAARRKQAEGDIGLETGKRVLKASSAGEGVNPVKRCRNLAWLSRSDLKRYEREAKERDMEKQREMAEFEHGPTKGNKREKRRMQNRLAQRAFRARSKIHQQEMSLVLPADATFWNEGDSWLLGLGRRPPLRP
jgi:hypothetical protein